MFDTHASWNVWSSSHPLRSVFAGEGIFTRGRILSKQRITSRMPTTLSDRTFVADKFDYYDAIAHLIPGTIGCLFLFYTLELLGIALPEPNVGSLGIVGIGIAVAYTVGHLLQALASSLEPFYYALWGGKPSVRLLISQSRQFSEEQRQRLIAELIRFFNVKEECPEGRKAAQHFHQRLFERCMALCNRNKLGRVDTFNAIYGFHRVLLTTFLLGFVTCVGIWFVQCWGGLDIPPTKVSLLKSWVFLTGMAAGIEIFRARKRAHYYAREVLWMTSDFIRASTATSEQSEDLRKS